MNKFFKSMIAVAIAAFTFTSCEDVPEPYEIPGTENGGTTETPDGVYVNESFASDFGTFQVFTLEGTPWIIDFKTAKASGYASGSTTKSESYLVSSAIDFTNATEAHLEFEYIYAYLNSDGECKVLITDSFNEAEIANSNWTDITGTLQKAGSTSEGKVDWNTFAVYSQNIPAAYIGKNNVRIAFYYNCSANSSKTLEVRNVKVAEGKVGENEDIPSTEGATGDGTLANPYNSIAANSYVASLPADQESEKDIYIKGKIASIKEEFGTQFGNATFYISDDGTENGQFYVFRTLYLGNVKYTGGENIKVGDEVIICGKVVNYFGNTPETVTNKSYIYSLNGKTAEGGNEDTPSVDGAKGDGTVNNPYNSIAANAVASALADGQQSDVVYIKGKIASIREEYNTQWGNGTFTISDDGTSEGEFLVYRALYLNNEKFTEGNEQIHVGDEVVVCGKLTNYMGNTPETVSGEAYLYSLKCNGGTTEEPETPSTGGDSDSKTVTVVAADLGYDNGAEMSTVTLSDGTTLTFDAGGNQNGPKYYNTGKAIRMYPKNSMKVTSNKKIASIVMTVDVYNGTTYNASGDLQANPGTTSTAENTVTFSGINNAECTITNTSTTTGAPSQVRMTQLKIVYAE